jgi:hypothetical protein
MPGASASDAPLSVELGQVPRSGGVVQERRLEAVAGELDQRVVVEPEGVPDSGQVLVDKPPSVVREIAPLGSREALVRRTALKTAPLSRGCRVIAVSSGGFKTIRSWLRTSLVVIVISRF